MTTGHRARRGGRRAGFTLLELLTAMAVLVIIVLIMSSMFHQSMRAWESGIRKTELSMEGRTAIGFIAHELSQAVADPLLGDAGGLTPSIGPGTPAGYSDFRFFSFDRASPSNRAVRVVSYWKSGDKLKRRVQTVQVGDGYPLGGAVDQNDLLDHVTDFQVLTPDAQSFSTNLPPWVVLRLRLAKTGKATGVRAWSAGPDMADDGGEDDDVTSWEPE